MYHQNEIFQKFYLIKVDLLVKYSLQKKKSKRFGWFLIQKVDFESTNFENFEEVVQNFGRSDDDMFSEKMLISNVLAIYLKS